MAVRRRQAARRGDFVAAIRAELHASVEKPGAGESRTNVALQSGRDVQRPIVDSAAGAFCGNLGQILRRTRRPSGFARCVNGPQVQPDTRRSLVGRAVPRRDGRRARCEAASVGAGGEALLERDRPLGRFDHGDQRMTGTTLLPLRVGLVAVALLGTPAAAFGQGLVQGVQQGAQAANKAAGPVGGVLGGAIGGVVGVFTGVLGVGNNAQSPAPTATNAPSGAKQAAPAKAAKTAVKGAKAARQGAPPAQDAAAAPAPPAPAAEAAAPAQEAAASPQQSPVLTQQGAPQLTAEQIVANSDANIDRIKAELNLTPVQAKNWSGFSSAMHYLSHNGADRLNLRLARAKRDPPDDIIEQMRNEAQFLNDRAIDQRNVADAAEPLFTSLDDKQRAVFIEEMVRLSHERGLD